MIATAAAAAPRSASGTSRLRAIGCPSCGGAAGRLRPGEIRACPYCAVPLMLVGGAASGSRSVDPAISCEAARRRVEDLLGAAETPRDLKARAARRELELVFLPFYDVLIVQATAVPPPQRCRIEAARLLVPALDDGGAVGADRITPDRVRGASARPFDATELAGRGTVLDPQRDPESVALPPVAGDPILIERRTGLLYYPVWLARYRWGRSLYEIAIDGVSGEVLRGCVPARADRRVLESVAVTTLLAGIAALAVAYPRVALGILHVSGNLSGLLLVGILLLTAAAWDRLRFRRELVVEGTARRLRPVNRPKETGIEKLIRRVGASFGNPSRRSPDLWRW